MFFCWSGYERRARKMARRWWWSAPCCARQWLERPGYETKWYNHGITIITTHQSSFTIQKITFDNIIYIIYILPSASRTHKFVGLFPKKQFFLQLWKKKGFSQKTCCFFFTRGKKTTFSHTWCHDFSWFVPSDDSNPFIDTSLGSIPLSTLHVDYASTLLALAGSSHKKGPDALGKCRTALSVITVNLESLDDFFPKNHP
jgi:hypothetical protein